MMYLRSAAVGLGLASLLAANGLQVDTGNKYTRQGSEMMAWEEDDGEQESQSRVAVLITGTVDSLMLTPLLANVVRANARKGLQVDLFFSLSAPSAPGQTMNPKMVNLRKNFDEVSFNGKVMDFVCQLAKEEGATNCKWEFDADEAVPAKAIQRSIMVHQPASSPTGKEAVKRWRSQARLWVRARAQELSESDGEDQYDAVMVTRTDTYFLAPFLVDVEGFQLESQRVSTAPCLDDTGISDKAVIMGRDAADVLLGIYEAWHQGEERLSGTRTAEEVWFRTAAHAGLNVVPEPMYAAQAIYTTGGLPCFSEETFKFGGEQPRFEQCFAESVGDAPVASLFKAFSCQTGNPAFYDLLWSQQAHKLHKVVADIANRNESDSILLMVVDRGEIDMAVDTLSSLSDGMDVDTNTIVIGTSSGVCKALADSPGASSHKCLVVVPQQDVRVSVLKHAILTTVASAGLSRRVVSVTPGVLFAKGMRAALAASSRTIAFATKSTTSQSAPACREEAGDDLAGIDGAFLALTDAPEATDMLLRAWQLMEEDATVSQQAALAAALSSSSYSEFGLVSCGLLSPPVAFKDRVVSAEQPPGVKEQIKREVQKASGSAWVDRFRDGASGQRRSQESSAVAERKSKAEWQRKSLEWKDAWAQRIRKLEEENGYNATAAREERIRQRAYNRAHKSVHRRHVRYLPAEEAAKVQAREEKWNAEQAKQKADDLQKAEARREAFKHQVEEAQRIIEEKRMAGEAQPLGEEEMSAA